MTITGDGFQAGATVKFSGTGVTVVSATVVSPTTLQLSVTIGVAAAVGNRDVTVTNPSKATAVCGGCFAVAARPTLTTLAPDTRPQGAAHAIIAVTGTGFQTGATIAVSGTGVTVHSVSFLDATRLDLDVSVDATARPAVAP